MVTGKHADVKIIIFLAAFAVLAYAVKPATSSSIDCIMDVKLCPDGSYVSRTGSQCEFSPCPEDGKKVIKPKKSDNSLYVPELILLDESTTSSPQDELKENLPEIETLNKSQL